MKTLICTMGLPRSGKTTWATAFSRDHNVPVVCPDSVRLAIHGQAFIAEAEGYVWATVRAMVKALFLSGHEQIILDATNTFRKRRDEWQSREWRTVFVVFDRPAADCKRTAVENGRDYLLPVIDRMAAQWEPLGADEKAIVPLGATGRFPQGALDPVEDEGELRLAIAADQDAGVVRIGFGKPVAWLGLPRAEALQLADKIAWQARKLTRHDRKS